MKFIFHAVVVMVVSRIPPVNKDCGRGAAVRCQREGDPVVGGMSWAGNY